MTQTSQYLYCHFVGKVKQTSHSAPVVNTISKETVGNIEECFMVCTWVYLVTQAERTYIFIFTFTDSKWKIIL